MFKAIISGELFPESKSRALSYMAIYTIPSSSTLGISISNLWLCENEKILARNSIKYFNLHQVALFYIQLLSLLNQPDL